MSKTDILQLQIRAEAGYLWLTLIVLSGLILFYWQRPILQRAMIAITHNPLPYIILISAVLRLPGMFAPLWYDELFSARFASIPLQNLPIAVMGDVHPPLYYFILNLTARVLGNGEIALRLPAYGFGLLSIYLAYRLTARLFEDRRIAVTTALFMAFAPQMIYYSTEARGYALLMCLVLVAALCILHNQPTYFFVVGAAMQWTHNIGYIWFVVLALTALFYWRSKLWLWLIFMSGVCGALWLPFMLQQSRDIADGFWIQTVTPLSPLSLWTETTISHRISETVALPVLIVAITLNLLALWHLRRNRLWFVLVAAAPALLAIASFVWLPVWLTRALLPSGVIMIIGWSYVVVNYSATRTIAIVMIVAAWWGYIIEPQKETTYWTVAEACAGADMVYLTDLPAAFLTAYYVPIETQVLWHGANDETQTLPEASKTALGFVSGDFADLQGDICLVAFKVPFTAQQELDHVADIVATYPVTAHTETEINLISWVNIYRIAK